MSNNNIGGRMFNLPLAELLDRLTITQIKLILHSGEKSSYRSEIIKLEHDINLILNGEDILVDATFIKNIVALSQINFHIWNNKDEMQLNLGDDEKYLNLLKLAHQLNGYRNKIKNYILSKESTSNERSNIKSNFETDGLMLDIEID
jgi:hypothetical protein